MTNQKNPIAKIIQTMPGITLFSPLSTKYKIMKDKPTRYMLRPTMWRIILTGCLCVLFMDFKRLNGT